jgi:hypothetical protein
MASRSSQAATVPNYVMQSQYFMGAPVPYGFPGAYVMPQFGQPNIGYPMGLYPPAVGAQQLPTPSAGSMSMTQGFVNASPSRQQIQPGVRVPHQQPQQSQGPNNRSSGAMNRRRQHPYNIMGGGIFPHDQMMPQPIQMTTEGGLMAQEQEGPSMLQVIRDIGFPQQQLQQQKHSSNEGSHTQHRKSLDHRTDKGSGGKKRKDGRAKDSDNNRTLGAGDKNGKQRDTTHYSLECDFPALVVICKLYASILL